MNNELAHDLASALLYQIQRLGVQDDDGATLAFSAIPGEAELTPVTYTTGAQVAMAGAELRMDREGITAGLLRAWLKGPAAYVMRNHGYAGCGAPHIGLWVTGGKVTLDVSYWLADVNLARTIGRQENQTAVWLWSDGRSCDCNVGDDIIDVIS